MILVLGATGKVGQHLVPALLDAGADVRALTRDPAKAKIDPRAEVVAGDLSITDDLPRLVDGVDKVFVLTSGYGPTGQEIDVAHAAARAGVKHLVKLSTTGVHFGQTDPITAEHAKAEQAIRDAGPAWTILRPGTFMDNRLAWRRSIMQDNAVYVAEGDPDSALVHVKDIAAVAAHVLTTPGHEGQAYQLTGSESLTTERQVEILSEAIGRDLGFFVEPEDKARERMAGWGWPQQAIDGVLELKRASGDNEGIVFDTVAELLGRPPLTFAEWAREKAAAGVFG